MAYAGLFSAAFLAATIFPFQSEAVLLALLLTEAYNWPLLIFVATVGNTAGSMVNWLIGRNLAFLERYKWFPVDSGSITKAEHWYQKYGKWSLLLSWVPIIGDPLTLAAGFLKEKFSVVLTLVAIAKFARYCVIAIIAAGLLPN